jgi:hypothetical protein
MRNPITLKRKLAGVTLVETAAAVGLLALFIATLLVLGSNLLGLLRSSQANISANQVLHERMEIIHTANWLQLTDANFLSTDFLATDAKSSAELSHPVETLTVSAYPPKAGMVAQVVRENHATRIVTSNPLLKNERMVRVDFTVNWKGFPRNRDRSRMTTSLISRAGSNKQ